MKQLILFRHAKSGWDDPVARDFDRPLNPRGFKAAGRMGKVAAQKDLTFDRIISSPAVRCTETLNGFLAAYGTDMAPQWDRRAYLASSATLLDLLHEVPDTVERLLLVGHNPGLEDLILTLVPDDRSSPLRDEVERKFPTASLAVMEWEGDWASLREGAARLTHFVRPRDVDPTLGPEEEAY